MPSSGINTTYIEAFTTGDNGIINVINVYIVPVIFTIALLVFLFGVAKAYFFNPNSDAERAKGHKLIFWGVIGFAVMLSIWGLVNLMRTIVGLEGDATNPNPPTIK